MLPDTVSGLPLHALVVHVVVVLLPLSALGAVVLALVPRWRATYGWLLLAVTVVSTASVPIATSSGSNLKKQLNVGGPVADAVRKHQDYAGKVIWFALGLLVFVALLLWVQRTGRRGALPVVLAALTVVAAVGVLVIVYLTGDAGARAVWNPTS